MGICGIIDLIDPSGIVYNAKAENPEDWPVPDATIVLQFYDPALNDWVDMNSDAYPDMMRPIQNPQLTNEVGRFAWDTAAGQYRVKVSRAGFADATSRVVEVPPEVSPLPSSGSDTDHTNLPGNETGNTDHSDTTVWLPILIGGKSYDQIAKASVSQESSREVLEITVDAARLAETASKSGSRPAVIVPVTEKVDKVTVVLTGDAVKAMETKQAIWKIRTPNGSFKLAALQIGIESLAKQLGTPSLTDIVVRTNIAKSEPSTIALLIRVFTNGSYILKYRERE